MSAREKHTNLFKEIEVEVEAEGREWTRRRLEHRLQEEADREGRVFPPQRGKNQTSAHRMANGADRGGLD